MPLILAIEPDGRQASRLAALAKSPLRAELLVAESTAKAFVALGTRTPDLVLTSLLLSPKDENELADRLRELDAAGIQVQTLVIPVLGTGARRSRQAAGGLLTRLRRSKGTSAVPEGCDPAVFAAQITEYLDRAAADRQAAAVALEDRLPTQHDPVYATRQEAQMAGSSSVGEATARNAAAREEAAALEQAARDAAAREEAALEEAVRDAAARETAAWEAVAREAAARERAAREEAAREEAAREKAAREQAIREAATREQAARAQAAREQAAREEAARAAAAREAAARDAAAAREQAAREIAARDAAAREQAAREQAAREEAARAAAAREAAAREAAAAREKAAREKAAREAAAREQAAREEAARAAAAREAAARDAAAAREQAAREKATREAAARERAAREQAAREEAEQAAAAREAATRDAAAAREQAAREKAARAAAVREHAAQEAAAHSRGGALDDDLAEFVAGIEDAADVKRGAHRGAPPPASHAAVDPVTQPEWKQLLTAIKRDIEHLRTEHPEAGAGSATQRSSKPSPKTGRPRTAGAKTRMKTPKPLEDEWGFFDPERCGFAALLTKLDAVTDPEDAPAKKPARPRH